MTKYKAVLTNMPNDVKRFIEAFQGQGNLRINLGEAVFEFEADDLWDSRNVIDNVLDDLTGYYHRHDIVFARPVAQKGEGD